MLTRQRPKDSMLRIEVNTWLVKFDDAEGCSDVSFCV